MTAIPDPASLTSALPSWPDLFRAVNEWRGSCLHHFTVAEMAVTETLLALDEVKPEGAKIRLRHLAGQRFEDLATVAGPDGPFGEAGRASVKAIVEYRAKHEAFRAQLCHGQITVAAEYSGNWLIVISQLTIRAQAPHRTETVIRRAEAHAMLEQLKRDGKRLSAVLGQLRKATARQA